MAILLRTCELAHVTVRARRVPFEINDDTFLGPRTRKLCDAKPCCHMAVVDFAMMKIFL